jgi:hypothetical protein
MNFLKLILANSLVFFVLLTALELFFYLNEKRFETRDEFILSQPEPYKNSYYFSNKFILESKKCCGYRIVEGTDIVLPEDFGGDFINVVDNTRLTVVNKKAEKKIYFFGGSTAMSTEVPDALTIPSLLQSLIEHNRLNYEVVNLGVSSIHSNQQLQRLQTIDLRPNDIVIFYDGVNEVTQRVYYGRSRGWILNEYIETPIFVKYVRRWSPYSAFLRYINDAFLTRKYFEFDEKIINKAVKDYSEAIILANDFTRRYDAYFFHFLQPNLATKKSFCV